MSALRDIARRGTVSLLHGAPGSMQSHVAHEIAFRCARAGLRVVVIDDQPVLDHLITWRDSKKVQTGERLRLEHVDDRSLEKSRDLGAALLAELNLRHFTPDVVVSTRLSTDPGGLTGRLGSPYLSMGADVFNTFGCGVLFAAHTGPAPVAEIEAPPYFNLWKCTAGLNLQVRVTGLRGEIIDLKGKEHGGGGLRTTIVFEDQEISHAK
jgi:hypothetical protein